MISIRFAKYVLLLILCAAHVVLADAQSGYAEIVQKTVLVLNRLSGPITHFVVPADADEDLVIALTAVAKVVRRDEVPRSEKYTLPRGYFVVEAVHYENANGEVVGTAGPGALKGSLGTESDCGMHYSINFTLTDGKWENGTYKTKSCVPPAVLGESAAQLRAAADRGDAQAQFRLGQLYKFGDNGLPKDDTQAALWYRKAAEQGNPEAQVTFAFDLAQGKGVEKNEAEAVSWYRKAALQGNAVGQNYLAGMLYKGYGVEQNYVEAAIWYRKSAEQGFVPSELILGSMLENGSGVKKDPIEAAAWYRKAADNGSEAAATRLKQLNMQH
jgi:TPR repeat protein